MSDTTTIPTPADIAPKGEPAAAPEQTSDTETVEFWKQKAREQEKRAKDNAGAAKRLAEIEAANKTAEEKAAERLAEAERRATELEVKATRAEVAASTGIPVDILAGPKDSTAEAVTEYAELVKAHFDRADTQRKKHGNTSPREGNTPSSQTDPKRAFLRGLSRD